MDEHSLRNCYKLMFHKIFYCLYYVASWLCKRHNFCKQAVLSWMFCYMMCVINVTCKLALLSIRYEFILTVCFPLCHEASVDIHRFQRFKCQPQYEVSLLQLLRYIMRRRHLCNSPICIAGSLATIIANTHTACLSDSATCKTLNAITAQTMVFIVVFTGTQRDIAEKLIQSADASQPHATLSFAQVVLFSDNHYHTRTHTYTHI